MAVDLEQMRDFARQAEVFDNDMEFATFLRAAADELEAARAVCEAAAQIDCQNPGEPLYEALAAYARAKGKGEGGGNDAK